MPKQSDLFDDLVSEALGEANQCLIDDLLAARGSRYGSFTDHAEVTQHLKGVLIGAPSYDKLTLSQREALDMIMHKVGRIVCGDPGYKDSWTDIVGYARLVEQELA